MQIRNRADDMSAIVSMVEGFGLKYRISATVINEINLCLDEVLSNIISYGYPENAEGEITVRLGYEPGRISAEILDDGTPFDPLQAGPPNLSGTAQTREVGGVGIYFVKQLMDDVAYRRVGNRNTLILRKKIPT